MDKKDRHFFKHDLGARNDEKIKKLRIKYKSSGYGAYMMLLEMLYESTDYMLEYDLESLAFDLRESKKFIKSIIEDFDLFVIEGGIFYSREVIRRMEKSVQISEKRASSIKKYWNKDEGLNEKSDTKREVLNEKSDTKSGQDKIRKEKKREEKRRE